MHYDDHNSSNGIVIEGRALGREHSHFRNANAPRQFGLLGDAYGNAFRVTFAKKPKPITKNLDILEAGARCAKVLEMSARK
jgi:hypothetical protein